VPRRCLSSLMACGMRSRRDPGGKARSSALVSVPSHLEDGDQTTQHVTHLKGCYGVPQDFIAGLVLHRLGTNMSQASEKGRGVDSEAAMESFFILLHLSIVVAAMRVL
jgi:hypothetical protein